LLPKNIEVKIFRTIILPVFVCGHGPSSLTLRVEHRLKVFERRLLRKICGSKRDEVIGECRRLHDKGIHDLYFSPNIIRMIKSRIKWVGHVAWMEREVHTWFWW
jgi:hypothetical protein